MGFISSNINKKIFFTICNYDITDKSPFFQCLVWEGHRIVDTAVVNSGLSQWLQMNSHCSLLCLSSRSLVFSRHFKLSLHKKGTRWLSLRSFKTSTGKGRRKDTWVVRCSHTQGLILGIYMFSKGTQKIFPDSR